MSGQRVNKKELARMKVLSDLGESPTAISKRMGKSHHTVIKYLREELEVFQDPKVQELIDIIRVRELEDLYLLGAKGRKRLHELMDGGDTKMIETIALVDRTFQQRRLLEEKSTANISEKLQFTVVYDSKPQMDQESKPEEEEDVDIIPNGY